MFTVQNCIVHFFLHNYIFFISAIIDATILHLDLFVTVDSLYIYILGLFAMHPADNVRLRYIEMDFNRVFSQAIARTVNKCYVEEPEIIASVNNWSFNPLIPPGCIPFLELAGLESGK